MRSLAKIHLTRLYFRQRGRCFYCEVRTRLPLCTNIRDQKMATVDHIVPLGQGGDNHFLNLVMACQRCNRFKGDREVTEANAHEFFRPWRLVHAADLQTAEAGITRGHGGVSK